MTEIEVETLSSDENNDDGPAVILFGGKGGVGKTTCASASGLKLAREHDLRTVIVSTDPAHSLSDVFETTDIGDTPTQIEEDLFGVEVDPRQRFGNRYSDKFQQVLERAQSFGLDVEDDDVDEVTSEGVIPGTDELAVIDLFSEYVESDEWDVVVFDTAPTGHTLRLLQLPGVAGSALEKVLKLKSSVSSVTGAVKNVIGGGGDDDDLNLSEDLTRAQSQMEDVSEVLQDESRTSFNVVTLPEEMPLAETERLLGQLGEQDITVGTILANKVLVDVNEDCDLCTSRRDEQQTLLSEADQNFNVPIVRLPLVANSDGQERLMTVANNIPLGGKNLEVNEE